MSSSHKGSHFVFLKIIIVCSAAIEAVSLHQKLIILIEKVDPLLLCWLSRLHFLVGKTGLAEEKRYTQISTNSPKVSSLAFFAESVS